VAVYIQGPKGNYDAHNDREELVTTCVDEIEERISLTDDTKRIASSGVVNFPMFQGSGFFGCAVRPCFTWSKDFGMAASKAKREKRNRGR
jgi:hypothetical protein